MKRSTELLGKREIKDGALALFRFDSDLAPVLLDNRLTNGQAYARPGVLLPMEPFEDLEDLFLVPGIDANTVVADLENPFTAALFRRDVNAWRPMAAVFDGIPDQILEHLHDLDRRAANSRQRFAVDFRPGLLNREPQVIQ